MEHLQHALGDEKATRDIDRGYQGGDGRQYGDPCTPVKRLGYGRFFLHAGLHDHSWPDWHHCNIWM